KECSDSKLRKFPECLNNISDTWFLSLNWCNSDMNSSEIQNLIKLHGTCNNPKSMILPTQEFRDCDILNKYYVADIALNLICECKELYLWGVSLTDYDVEIHSLIF